MAVEDPGDSPIISASYGMRHMRENSTDFLPFFGTDFGFCSLVKPQLNFDEKYSNLSFRELYGPTSETSSYRFVFSNSDRNHSPKQNQKILERSYLHSIGLTLLDSLDTISWKKRNKIICKTICTFW